VELVNPPQYAVDQATQLIDPPGHMRYGRAVGSNGREGRVDPDGVRH
jgi:hypothetical protein